MKSMIRSTIFGLSTLSLMACTQGYNFDLPATSQEYGQNILYNNNVDVIFVVDTSKSMSLYQDQLAAQVPSMVSKLQAQKLNIHYAVVTTSMGGTQANGGSFIGSPAFVTNDTPDVGNVLAQRVRLGQGGSDLERGLDSLAQSLSPGNLNGNGHGFLRDEALLAIIALSNEDDKSVNSGSSSAASMANFLDGLKGFYDTGERRWMMNFVGVLSLNSPCISNQVNESRVTGDRWIALANQSNGIKESICTGSLSSAVGNVRSRIAQILTDFHLPKKPLIESISVVVNGQPVPRSNIDGWDYVASINSVRFYGNAVPSADASIVIDFKPAEAN